MILCDAPLQNNDNYIYLKLDSWPQSVGAYTPSYDTADDREKEGALILEAVKASKNLRAIVSPATTYRLS